MKLLSKLFLALIVMVVLTAAPAHADTAVSVIQVPSWLESVIKALENLPIIGHVLVAILGFISIASPVLTALTAFLMAIEKAFNLAGMLPAINFLNQKVIPWVGMFSNFNVQAPTAATTTVASTVAVAPTSSPVTPSS